MLIMRHPLQNNPGSDRFPVEIFSWFRFKKLSFARRATSLSLIILGLIFLGTIGGPIMIMMGVMISVVSTSKLRREQKKYYKLSNSVTPTDLQLEALQIGSFISYAESQWCDTLETWPCEQRVKGNLSKFKSLKVIPTSNLLGQMEDSWGIISRDDYLDTFESLVNGMHTKRFVSDFYSQENPEKMAQRICGLVQKEKKDFYELLEAKSGVRKLIWAWDLTRAVSVTRWAYESGFVEESEAWDKILMVSAYAHTVYDSLEDFFVGVRFGHAYWSNNFEQAVTRGKLLDSFQAKKTPHRIFQVG